MLAIYNDPAYSSYTVNVYGTFYVTGIPYCASQTSFSSTSDERVKTNIMLADISLCYNTIKNIPLKRYTWRDDIDIIKDIVIAA